MTTEVPRAPSARAHIEELFEICDELLVVLDAEDRVQIANPAALRAFGASTEELVGRSFAELVHPQDQGRIPALLRELRENRARVTFSVRSPGHDGSTGLVDWRAQHHPGSGTVYLMGTDVTRSTGAEKRHRELSSRHSAMLAAIPDIVAEVDRRRVYTWVNDAGLAFFGPGVVGREAREFFEEDPERVFARVDPVFEDAEDTIYVETWQRRADGEKRLLGWWCRGLKNEDGSVIGALSAARDITEEKRVLESLRESERTVQALFENAAQGIVSVDRSGRIASANSMAERQFGYSREELIGQPVEILLPESRSHSHLEHRHAYFSAPRARPMGHGLDLTARRKDATEFPVEISLSHIDTKNGTLAVAFINDITERKGAEVERERLERHLEHATKMEAVGRLAGGIAHDFNNLLTALSGFSEIALDELPESHPLYEGARETFKTCQRSASLVRRLLAVSRRQVLQPQVLDLNAKVSEIEKMLRSVLGEDIELIVKLKPELGFVRVDESQIEQVLLNLVVNARDAMPQGGRLIIETGRTRGDEALAQQTGAAAPGPLVLLTVSDTGCGMDADTLQHVFEPFFTTKERGKGTGLGLATVYGIVRQSGGHIWAYSEPGSGTSFKVYLPRFDREGVLETATAASGGRSGSETILVVEDENTVRLVATSNLRKAGYQVLEARDGEEALRLAREHSGEIDLVLTDVVMPRLNGPQLVARLQELRPRVKVLYMSGHADDALVHHGILEEGLSFLEKPFTRETLSRRVREQLDTP